jgi:DNA-binding MarR family transcriptional regulator
MLNFQEKVISNISSASGIDEKARQHNSSEYTATETGRQVRMNESFTRIPNWFLDQVAPELNPTQLRVMLYIYRHTIGYGKTTDRISYDQFVSGIVTYDGRRIDRGAGVSRRALVDALSYLEKQGLITRCRNEDSAIPAFAIVTATPTLDSALTVPPMEENNFSTTTTTKKENNQIESEKQEFSNIAEESSSHPLIKKFQKTTRSGIIRKEQVQKLHLEDKNSLGSMQNLHDSPVQNLHSTIENQLLKQNKINRVGLSRRLSDSVAGLSSKQADKLVKIAEANGRDEAYLFRLVEYVTSNSVIHTPAAVLTSLIKSNQDRTLHSEVPYRQRTNHQTVRQNQANPRLIQFAQQLKSGELSSSPSSVLAAITTISTTEPVFSSQDDGGKEQEREREGGEKGHYLPSFTAGDIADRPSLKVCDLSQVWEKIKANVIEQWSVSPLLLKQGKLYASNDTTGGLVLDLPDCQDSMIKIRIVQALRRVVGEECQIRW